MSVCSFSYHPGDPGLSASVSPSLQGGLLAFLHLHKTETDLPFSPTWTSDFIWVDWLPYFQRLSNHFKLKCYGKGDCKTTTLIKQGGANGCRTGDTKERCTNCRWGDHRRTKQTSNRKTYRLDFTPALLFGRRILIDKNVRWQFSLSSRPEQWDAMNQQSLPTQNTVPCE